MDVQAKQFRHGAMLKVAEVSNATLQNWLKRGLVLFNEGGNRHAKRLYSAEDIVVVRTMVTCIESLHMEARYAAVVAQKVAVHTAKFYAPGSGKGFMDRVMYCQFKGDEIVSWEWIGTMEVLEPIIAIPVGRIIMSVISDLDILLYGPHDLDAYKNMNLSKEEIEKKRKRDAVRQQYLMDDTATEMPREISEDN